MFTKYLNWLETALGWCLSCFLNGCGLLLIACVLAIVLAIVFACWKWKDRDPVKWGLFGCHCSMYTVGLVGGLMLWIGGFGMMFGGFVWIPLKILTFLFN